MWVSMCVSVLNGSMVQTFRSSGQNNKWTKIFAHSQNFIRSIMKFNWNRCELCLYACVCVWVSECVRASFCLKDSLILFVDRCRLCRSCYFLLLFVPSLDGSIHFISFDFFRLCNIFLSMNLKCLIRCVSVYKYMSLSFCVSLCPLCLGECESASVCISVSI